MKEVTATIQSDMDAVNRLILEQLHSDVALVENIGHYIVESGGKRLRPQLVLLAAKSLGYQGDSHIQFAAIIEFIHTATLLHDDVVDVSSLRRGRPTANAQWGNAPSVLVGDFVYSRAFQMMVRLGEPAILSLMADTTNRIAEGEVLQLVHAGEPDTTEAAYREVIERKTAVLFQAATLGGAILAGGSPAQQQALADYGMALGNAFQLIDDALDYAGDSAVLGKQVGDDIAEGKMTLPLIHTLQHCRPDERDMIQRAIRERDRSLGDAVMTAVRNHTGLAYTRAQAALASESALQSLQALPPSPQRTAMETLTRLALERDH
ncbi:MAG: octaprenyl diphosphate synthase [Gammaproteobacteria bacterium]|nr:MAG: octaprenyl diphosphate synthase [Gammaproteobacteria bacterium]